MLLLLLIAGPAYAGAWKLEIMGGKALGSAYAGNAVITEDASSAWFNPAAMTYLDETTITGGSAFIDLSIEHNDLGTTSFLGEPINGPKVTEGGSFFPVPHGYMVVPLGERLRFGVGFNTPYGLGTDYGETWVGRYQAVNTELLVYNLNPSLAWRVSDELSVGAGINIQYADASFGEMIDFGSIGAISGLPLTPQQHDGKVDITGDDWMVGYNLGMIWRPVSTTKVGSDVSFRHDCPDRGYGRLQRSTRSRGTHGGWSLLSGQQCGDGAADAADSLSQCFPRTGQPGDSSRGCHVDRLERVRAARDRI